MGSRRGALLALVLAHFLALPLLAIDPIPRRLPPPGIKIPDDVRQELQDGLDKLAARVAKGPADAPWTPDVMVFHKAVDFALKNGEFYNPNQFDAARKLLAAANERLDQLEQGQAPWRTATGRQVRGFRSSVDGSIQPYGIDVPAGHDFYQPAPLVVWLHGRGEQQCDLQFVFERMTRGSEFNPAGAIVLHPFGRQCVGYKSAGETDVLEAIEAVRRNYRIDDRRIALMGFSMGGAGVWHIGAHYTGRFCVIAPGAGFSETPKFLKLKPEQYPPWYEQTLWGQYDVPFYARNLLHVPLIAYSGEIDGQKQAADVMAEALATHNYTLQHLIGPKTGHSYHPETKKEVLAFVEAALQQGQPAIPPRIHFQTRTLRYHKLGWVEVYGLGEHWREARVDATLSDGNVVTARTENVTAIRFRPTGDSGRGFHVKLDGKEFGVPTQDRGSEPGYFVRGDRGWQFVAEPPRALADEPTLAKRPGLQGPIDDAFVDAFLVVTPSGKCKDAKVQEWIEFELEHQRERWRTVLRGILPEKKDSAVTAEDIKTKNLVLWGDPDSNAILARIAPKLPVQWSSDKIAVGDRQFDRAAHVPAFIYPNPLNPGRYVVVNSGPTFREFDDANNSRQNPRLPDWAIIGLDQPPDIHLPGRIVAADFFDEQWQLKPPRK